MLRELVKERLMAAADEILALFERTIASYEEELSRTREENERHRRQLEAVGKVVLHAEDVQQLIDRREEHPARPQGGSSTLEHGNPQTPHIKEEEEELWVTQEEPTLTELPPTVKTEDHEDKPRLDSPLAPLSDSEAEDMHDTREPLSSDTECEGDTSGRRSKKVTGKKRFSCSVCDRSFSFKRDLNRHMRTHTGEKPFSCSVCEERFARKSYMVSHVRTHTGEKPFSCLVCGDKFVQSSTLSRHMRTHTGEKPFSCLLCGKSFSCKSNMNVHMRIHTVEKPFSCSVCGKMYSHKKTLTAHMLTHSGE
ncbi:zinc finger protein 12-like [Dunckerocampus dactyliophorus]|uniref:zinc finger protein 12-like n=1 Tax=Dunckerocampus dactyliophorus TaxID=161453 RepID=UPI002406EC76|nr:zinc finger protein 12-like [Dunckerocampus dactyliophorus]